MAFRTIEVALRANVGQFQAQMGTAAASVKNFDNQVATTVASSRKDFEALGKVGLAMGAAFLAGAALSIKAAIDYESAFTGVSKTVDGTKAQMGALSDGIRAMSRQMPASAVEIAGVAEAAGALGVKTEDILGFTKVMVDLGETTNLSADQAATSLARFMNIMGTAGDDVDELGSTLVELGNNGASTEAEIMELGLRLAGAGKQAGLSESDVLGFANALSSMGVEAEAGGTAFSRVFVRVNDAVIDGGAQLELFAEVAGMSAEEFRAAYEDDAAGAIVTFIEGLGGIQDSGASTTNILKDLELGEIRVSDALRRTAGNSDLLRSSLADGNRAWGENSALQTEAEKRYQTTSAQIEILRNNVVDLAIGFGEKLLPAVGFVADRSTDLIKGFQTMSGPMQTVATVTGSLVGVLGGAAGVVLVFGDRIRGGIKAMQAFGEAFPRLGGAIAKGAVGLGAAGVAVTLLASAMGAAERQADELVEELTKDIDTTNLDSVTEGLGRVQAKLVELREDKTWSNWERLTDGLKGTLEVFTPLENTVLDNAAAMKALEESETQLLGAQVRLDLNTRALGDRLGLTREDVEKLAEKTGIDLSGAFTEVVPAMEAAYGTMTEGVATSDKAILSFEEQEAAAKALGDVYKALGEAIGAFTEPMQAWQTVLDANTEAARTHAEGIAESTEDAEDSWQDYATTATVSLSEFSNELQNQIDAQDNWADNLLKITARGREDVARELAAMGPEGAALAAQFADATDEEFTRAADLMIESVRRGTIEGGQEMDLGLKIMAEIARQGADGTVQSVADALSGLPGISEEIVRDTAARAQVAIDDAKPAWAGSWSLRGQVAMARAQEMQRDVPPMVGATADGMTNALSERHGGFASWVRRYHDTLVGGINTLAIAVNSKGAIVGGLSGRAMADGGLVEFYARGGMKEAHQAQIARAGDWRVWAEPETGGEAYIPLSPAKRDRSTAILQEVADRFGLSLRDMRDLPRGVDYHDGGLYTPPPAPTLPGYGHPIRPAGEETAQGSEAFVREWARRHMDLDHHQVPEVSGGKALARVQSVLPDFPGLRITSTYRSPGANAAVGGAKRSYHMDRNNPAVDVGGPTRQLDSLHAVLKAAGGWRELLWRVKGHYDHVHAAEEGGIFNGFQSFDQGGMLQPGWTNAYNGTGRPEEVMPNQVPTEAQRFGMSEEEWAEYSRKPDEMVDAIERMHRDMNIGFERVTLGVSSLQGAVVQGVDRISGAIGSSIGGLGGSGGGGTGADGGGGDMVRAEDGTQVPQSFYSNTSEGRYAPLKRYMDATLETGDWRNDWITHLQEGWREPLRGYFSGVAKTDDYQNDWITHVPSEIRDQVRHYGMLYAQKYDVGGWLEPGFTLAYNGTGRREAVMPVPASSGGLDFSGLEDRIATAVGRAMGNIRGDIKIDQTFNQPISPQRVAREMARSLS